MPRGSPVFTASSPVRQSTKTYMNAEVSIDATGVQEAIDMILEAVSPLGLAEFMEASAAPYLQDEMINRFSSSGGGAVPGGAWAALQESTIKIRQSLGYNSTDINERTGDLLNWLLTHDINTTADGVVLDIPGGSGDSELQKKLLVAQEGWVQGPNELIPGAVTPPRPVLAVDDADVAALLSLLQVHIIMSASRL